MDKRAAMFIFSSSESEIKKNTGKTYICTLRRFNKGVNRANRKSKPKRKKKVKRGSKKGDQGKKASIIYYLFLLTILEANKFLTKNFLCFFLSKFYIFASGKLVYKLSLYFIEVNVCLNK